MNMSSTPATDCIDQFLAERGEYVGLVNLSNELESSYWYTRECLLRLEEARRIRIDKPGPGRGNKWTMRTMRGSHER